MFSYKELFKWAKKIKKTLGYGYVLISLSKQVEVYIIAGSFPPEVKATQAKRFNSSKGFKVLLATDAIGMGMNLDIKRIIFTTLEKNAKSNKTMPLTNIEIQQIAGRAGRDTQEGLVTAPTPKLLERIQIALDDTSIHNLQEIMNHEPTPAFVLPPEPLLNEISDDSYLLTQNNYHLKDISD